MRLPIQSLANGRLFFLCFLILAPFHLEAGLPEKIKQTEQYQIFLDLNQVIDDKLKVEIIVPVIEEQEIEYHIPKIVPGTYAVYDFGRFISEFSAQNQEGEPLEVEQLSENRWKIKEASRLYKISYWVDDSFDSDLDNHVFEPAGTNIEQGKNFIINNHGFFGYLEGRKRQPFKVKISRPSEFYGATSLNLVSSENDTDVFLADNYMDLVDSPIMYNRPDTITQMIGGAKVLVSVYSPNDVLSAHFVMDNIREILFAQKEYLGGTLPVDRYSFIIYLFKGKSGSGGYGALEHSYSSVYFLPEADPEALVKTVRDVSAHEFFHIVTPLNIHSEEIHNFNFIEPKMSKHLWLYEGITEYFAHHVQVKHGLISFQDYLDNVQHKMEMADRFKDDLPFTELSAKCLDEHKDQYYNVYMKGALIGLCLDIQLRNLSNGKYGIQELMADLSKSYGKHQAFKDEELFAKIEELTFPEIGEFLRTYVDGPSSLPIRESLALAGINYDPEKVEKQISMGNISLGIGEEGGLSITDVSEANQFAKDLGYQEGDELIEFNKQKVSPGSFAQVVKDFKDQTEPGDKVRAVVFRTDGGKKKKVKLKARAIEVEVTRYHILTINKNPSQEQMMLRKAWINQ